MKFSQLKAKVTKRTLVIILAGLLVLTAAAYVTYSGLAWQNYSQSADEQIESTYEAVNSSADRPLDDDFTASDKRASLNEVIQRVGNQVAAICRPPALVEWQTVFTPLEERVVGCQDRIATLEMEVQALHNALDYIEAELELAEVILAADDESTDLQRDDQQWSKVANIWQQVAKDVADIGGPSEYVPIKEAASQRILAIGEAWHQLEKAHQEQDRAGFAEAQANLDKAYAKLKAIEELSSDIFNQLD